MCSIYIRFAFNIDQFGCIFEEKRRISIIIPGKRKMKQVSYRSIKIVNVLFLRKTNVNVIPISFILFYKFSSDVQWTPVNGRYALVVFDMFWENLILFKILNYFFLKKSLL